MAKALLFTLALVACIAVLAYLALSGGAPSPWQGDSPAADAGGLPGNLPGQRESYGVSGGVFSRLPEPPRDFNAVVTHYLNTGTPDESFFSPKYYLQPEFYPSFIGSGLGYWTAPSTTHWAAYGYGSFPVRKTVDAAVGEKSAVTFFVHSGYGVRSWQGMGFRTIVSGDGNAIITIAPSEILLGPSFPSFTAAWARKITVGITPESAGSYNVKVFASAPLEASSQKWSADSSARGMQYFDAGFAGTEIPLIEIAVEAK